jgi:hypothetical protein
LITTTATDQAVMREIRAGRYQNASAISGRNMHALRLEYDADYRRRHTEPQAENAPAVAPIVVRMPLSATKMLKKSKAELSARRVQKNWQRSPAPAEFIATNRARRERLGWTITDLAFHVGCSAGAVSNAFSPGGHLSPVMKDRIERALTKGEIHQQNGAAKHVLG